MSLIITKGFGLSGGGGSGLAFDVMLEAPDTVVVETDEEVGVTIEELNSIVIGVEEYNTELESPNIEVELE